MFSNEEDAHVAYQKLNERTDKWEDAIQLLKKGMEDEGQHKKWFEDKTR
jgi:hypothetical protein